MSESPAVEVIHLLREAGATVRVFDPYIAEAPELGGLLVESVTAAAAQADAIILLVHHREFLDLDPMDLADVVKQRLILDTRNVLARQAWDTAEFKVLVLGDGKIA